MRVAGCPCGASVVDRDSQHAIDLVTVWLHVPDDLDGSNKRCLENPLWPGCH
jgi:hypothetical protein